MESGTRTAELMFIPAPFTGHIFSAVEIAKLLVNRDPRLSITVLIMNLPFDSNATAYASSLAATFVPSKDQPVSFIALPQLDLENFTLPTSSTSSSSASSKFQAMIEDHNPLVREAVAKLRSDGIVLAGFIIDMVCTPMIDVANEFGLPTYLYYASGAAFLSLSLHLRALYDEHNRRALTDFISSDAELIVPGFINPVQIGRSLPTMLTDEVSAAVLLGTVARFKETKGILVNTFQELDAQLLRAFCGDNNTAPTVYPVGPVLNLTGGNPGAKDQNGQEVHIMSWLDDQPPSSVVFLCFGSMGSFGEEQVREIANGLERSGHRFILSLRKPPPQGKLQPSEYENIKEVLPEGFLGRTSEIGMVIGWAPQVAILSHPAIGGFVSHCGWNSILESLWFGVPIATWPVYAEQQLNAFTMVKELGFAIALTLDYRKDILNGSTNFVVSAEDVERGVRSVMDQHNEVRSKVKVMMEASRKALVEEGSSYLWLGRFIEDVIINMS